MRLFGLFAFMPQCIIFISCYSNWVWVWIPEFKFNLNVLFFSKKMQNLSSLPYPFWAQPTLSPSPLSFPFFPRRPTPFPRPKLSTPAQNHYPLVRSFKAFLLFWCIVLRCIFLFVLYVCPKIAPSRRIVVWRLKIKNSEWAKAEEQ